MSRYNRDDYDDPDDYRSDFAEPGSGSALRAASASNPRNQPCPTCEWPNRLTPADVARGYQCNRCAEAYERGGEIDYYEPDSEGEPTGDPKDWTDEDEAALEEHEEAKRRRIAEDNEY